MSFRSEPVVLDPGRKATTPDEPQTVDGWVIGPITKFGFRGQVIAWLWQPDPRGWGIKGPTRWYMNGEPVDPDDPALKTDTIPFFNE